jgi:predicted transcriptional regulator
LWGGLANLRPIGKSAFFGGQPIPAANPGCSPFQPLFVSRFAGFWRKRRSRQGPSAARVNALPVFRVFVSRVASPPVFAYLEGMEVHFSPDVETRLQQVALANGKDAEQLVKDTVTRMLENQNRFIAGVQRGIEQADRGEFVEHKDVVNRIDRLFQS